MGDLIGDLIAEVLESLFQLIKFPSRGRSRSKNMRTEKKLVPTFDGRPPHTESSAE